MILHPLYWLGIKFSSKFLLNLLGWKKNKTLLITYLKLNELSFSVMSLVYFYTINTSLKSYKKDFIFELILWIDVALLKNFKGLQWPQIGFNCETPAHKGSYPSYFATIDFFHCHAAGQLLFEKCQSLNVPVVTGICNFK